MKDIRQSQLYAKYLESIGWQTKKIEGNYIFVKKFPVLGNFVKIQRPKKLTKTFINKVAELEGVFQIIIEPDLPFFSFSQKQLLAQGFKLSQSSYLPSKTLVIDLTKSLPKIQANFKKDARGALRKNQNTEITRAKDIKHFRDIWTGSVPRTRYVMSLTHLQTLKKAFGNNCQLLLDENQNAGAIFLVADKRAYYWQAFTSQKGRKQMIQYKIVWEGIVWAKKQGAQIFDFEGIYDERFPNPKWKGFTHFKKSFSQKEREYPGCFTKTNWSNLLRNILGTAAQGTSCSGKLPEQILSLR